MNATPSPPAAVDRRLLIAISAVVFVDTMFYAVIAPLLPTLSHELHLSKLSAGVMTASYPLGTLIGSLPGGILAARAGPRPTVITGLALLGGSTIAFALLHDAASLDCARFVEGVGGACSWAGGIAWISAETPPERRGELIGRTLAAAIGGALFGPVIGTLATALGRPTAFGAVVVAAGALIVVCRGLRSSHVTSEQGIAHVRSALSRRGIGSSMWLVALPAIASGVMSVLAPLRLHRLGASAAAIGATFLAAAVAEAFVSPLTGRLSDRRGRLLPLRVGLIATAGLLASFTLPRSALLLAALVVAVDGALGVFWAPAMAMLSETAERHALDQGLAAALMNLAWAAGQTLGSGLGGPIAGAAGDFAPAAIAGALCLGTLAALSRSATRGRLRPSAGV